MKIDGSPFDRHWSKSTWTFEWWWFWKVSVIPFWTSNSACSALQLSTKFIEKEGICSRPPQNLMTGGGFCCRSLFSHEKKQVTKREQKTTNLSVSPPLSVSPAICATWQYLSYEIMGSGSPVGDGVVDHPKFASESNFLKFSWQKQFKDFKKKTNNLNIEILSYINIHFKTLWRL